MNGEHFRSIARAEESRKALKHNGLYGDHNEGLIIEALRDFFGDAWGIGSGEVIDVHGNSSNQCDVIVYDSRLLPAAYRSSTGKVIVSVHAVAAVIEVKSTLRSSVVLGPGGKPILEASAEEEEDEEMEGTSEEEEGEQEADTGGAPKKKARKGDCQLLCEQIATLQRFMNKAYCDGNKLLQKQCSGAWGEFYNKCSPPPVYGLCYNVLLLPETARKAFAAASQLLEEDMWIFSLDVQRSAASIQALFSGKTSGKDLLEAATEARLPSGYFFEVGHTSVAGVGGTIKQYECKAHEQGSDTLRFLLKVIHDTAHTSSPTRANLGRADWECVFNRYHEWVLE